MEKVVEVYWVSMVLLLPHWKTSLLWNSENIDHQKYFWNVIVLKEI